MNPRRAVLVLWGLAACLAAGTAQAADWSFDPVVSLTAEHNNNVQFAGGGGVSDNLLVGAVTLSWTASTPRSATTFAYIPVYEWYQDNGDLGNLAHNATLVWRQTASRRTTWDASVYFSRRERPQFSFLAPEADLVVIPRTQTTTLAARFGGRFLVAPRSRLFFGTSYATTSFDAETLETPDGEIVTVEDAREFGVDGGYEYDISPLTVGRVFYRGTAIDEGRRGRRLVHRALFGFTHGPSTGWQWTFAAGPATIDVQEAPEGEASADPGVQWVADLSVRRPILRTGAMVLGASRDFASTGGVTGSARVWAVYGAWTIPAGRYSAFSVLGRYASRSPLEGLAADARTTTRTWRAEYAAAFGPKWAAVVFAEQVSQSAADDIGLRSGYKIYGIGLRWTPNALGAPRV